MSYAPHDSVEPKSPDLKGVDMLNEEIMGRLSHLKNNVQQIWDRISENDFELPRKKIVHASHMVQSRIDKILDHNEVTPHEIQIENYHYESHRVDDLPLTITKDPGPGIKYSYTENSEFARGAPKTEAHGIDSFGEEDTFDPDEADDHQDYRNRKQNSDLSERFYTGGMDIDKKDLHH